MAKFHFHLGPVQTFVAQSRRTRDLWAGSYLLSYLSGVAIAEAQKEGAQIDKPFVAGDLMLAAIKGQELKSDPGASLPNHFTATIDGDDQEAARVARACDAALRSAWGQVCEAVWSSYLAPLEEEGCGTRQIFDRQVTSFWDIYWVVGQAGSALAMRKLSRVRPRPSEPGEKCVLMGNMQELSGFVNLRERGKRDDFWRKLRKKVGRLDLHPQERLCGPALVKRLYPKVDELALGWSTNKLHWPSTAYLAAAPFIKEVLQQKPQEAMAFAEHVREVGGDNLFCQSASIFGFDSHNDFARLDGNFFYERLLGSPDNTPLNIEEERKSLVAELKSLAKSVGTPLSHFALLAADGDNMGKLLQEESMSPQALGKALNAFGEKARQVIQDHLGFVIYLGGDDLLAMLPADSALQAADAIEQAWRLAFKETCSSTVAQKATISAALVIAPLRAPLRRLMQAVHDKLDLVAKSKNNRCSLAISLWKGQGEDALWVTSWEREAESGSCRAVDELTSFAQALSSKEAGEQISSSFLHRMEQNLAMLTGSPGLAPGERPEVTTSPEVMESLLKAEYAQSVREKDSPYAGVVVSKICRLLKPHIGPSSGEKAFEALDQKIELDALAVARFLSKPTQEEN
ncbi:MAG: type III-B CRISPR-associated protein Cas10/Cmr2 [Planctomycetes bacterium]|nr:type III-B CRISPR-associated protein Cas10/Cmr2 [Planctomycetota bacterium]